MPKLRRFLAWSAATIVVLLIAGALLGRLALYRYLNSPEFRTKMSAAAARALGAEAEFAPFQISGFSAYTDSLQARGGVLRHLAAQQIRTELNYHGLFRRTWQLDELTVEKLEVDLATEQAVAAAEAPVAVAPPAAAPAAGWKIDLREARIRTANLRWDAFEANGVALHLKPAGDSWEIAATGGRVAQTGWPEAQLDQARLRYQGGTLFITQCDLHSRTGQLALSGEYNRATGPDLRATLTNFELAPFLEPDWRARLNGRLQAEVNIRAAALSGHAQVDDAQLTAFPLLDQIALFTQTQRFRTLALTAAECDFTRDAQAFTARNVVLESAGLLRVEGSFRVANGQIDGDFQVGVAPATLQWLPGSRARVFTVAREGYLWAPMKLTGPVGHPVDDLTPRLVSATAGEVIEQTTSTIRDTINTGKSLLDQLLR